jgi:hypothetical protein
MPLALALVFVVLTGAGGQKIFVNPAEVTTLRQPRETEHYDLDVQCVVGMANGKFFGVEETCETAKKSLEYGQ